MLRVSNAVFHVETAKDRFRSYLIVLVEPAQTDLVDSSRAKLPLDQLSLALVELRFLVVHSRSYALASSRQIVLKFKLCKLTGLLLQFHDRLAPLSQLLSFDLCFILGVPVFQLCV